MSTHTPTHTHTHTHTHTNTHTKTHTHTLMHPLSLTHSHTLALTSTHAHTHTRTHTCETRDGHEKQILLLESRLLEEGQKNCLDFIVTHLVPHTTLKCLKSHLYTPCCEYLEERWGAGVETQKNVRGEVGGWGRVPFNEPYAPLLSTIYDGA